MCEVIVSRLVLKIDCRMGVTGRCRCRDWGGWGGGEVGGGWGGGCAGLSDMKVGSIADRDSFSAEPLRVKTVS